MAGARVLIVEDEAIVAHDIQSCLQQLEYVTTGIAATHKEAVQLARRESPDIVLMDIRLRDGSSGIDAAREIRSFIDVPVVYLTAYSDEETLEAAKLTAPHGYILKPFNDRKMRSVIETALYKHEIEKKLRESEQWLSTTLNSIGDAVIATDRNGTVMFMNPVAERLTGWSEEDAQGRDMREVFNIVNEESRLSVDDPVSMVFRSGVVVGLANHTLLIGRDGREVPIDDSAAPIRNEAGEIIGVVLVFRDVSERKIQEESLRESEERYRCLFETAHDALLITDGDGKYLDTNPSAEALTGFTRQELIGMQIHELMNEQDRAAGEDLVSKLAGRGLQRGEYTVRRKDGSPVEVEYSAARLAPGRFQFILRDISERRRSELVLQRKARQQEAVSNLGRLALGDSDPDRLFNETVRLLAEVLEVEYCQILRLDETRNHLLLTHGIGWNEGIAGNATVGTGVESQAGYTIASDEPVIVRDLSAETRFRVSDLLISHDVVSGVSVVIQGEEGQYGVLGVHSTRPIPFTSADASFVQATANILGTTIERRKKEDRIAESEERFRQLAETVHEVFWIISPQKDRMLYISPAYERIWGRPSTALYQNAGVWMDYVHPDDFDRVQSAASGDKAYEFDEEYRIVRPDGEVRWIWARDFPVRDSSGNIVRIVGIAEDITDRKRYETELIEAKDRAEQMARLKTAFLANMSHEIRTPLTGIIGFAELMAPEMTGELQGYARLIEKSGRRLLDTLNSVLELANLESGRNSAEAERAVWIDAIVEDAVELLQPLATDKGIEVLQEFKLRDLYARMDEANLHRILTNLIGNAVKFTHEGSIRVEVDATESEIIIQVRDTGIGIDREFLPYVFDEFRQESSGVGRSHEGAGLGLTITRKLVEMSGGSISVESEKGTGTTFRVVVPRSHEGTAGDPATEFHPASLTKAHRVLVVEDIEDSRLLIGRILGEHCEVDLVADGEIALQMLDTNRYAAVLLDINLGAGLSGAEILRRIRKHPHGGSVPVLALTAYALPGDKEQFMDSGFDAYLGKPFTRKQILSLVTELVTR